MAGIRSRKEPWDFVPGSFCIERTNNMDHSFEYTTIDEQIKKLKSQHLLFENEAYACTCLRTYGYYNIINGYRDPYIIRDYDRKTYVPDISFEQIFSLFTLDHNIRNSVLLAMIDLEEHLRAVCAEIISDSFGSDYNQYLLYNNYRDKHVSDPKFNRNNVLNSMKKVAELSHSQPIKYYREEHNIIPPWILFKGIYFGTLVNYIRFFKKPQRDRLVTMIYGNVINHDNIEDYKSLLSDSLFMCLEYRNLAAHGGRIYNYIPNSSIRNIDSTHYKKGLSQLLYILDQFGYRQPYERLYNALNRSLTQYCSEYNKDLQRLEQAIGFNIEVLEYVWVNTETRKYHSNRYCSGSLYTKQMELNQVRQEGFIPCKRCSKSFIE